MPSDIAIRPLIAGDEEKIRSFFDAMGDESSSFFNVNHGNEKRVMGFFSGETKNHSFFIAEKENICAGIMFIWDLEKSIPWFGIAVRDGMQGQGIGKKMIDYLKSYLKDKDFGGLLLRTSQSNIAAQKLYEKCGFERIGIHPSGEYLYILRLEIEL